MSTNWISKLGGRLSRLHSPMRPHFNGFNGEADADARRIRAELDAIRARFPDHA